MAKKSKFQQLLMLMPSLLIGLLLLLSRTDPRLSWVPSILNPLVPWLLLLLLLWLLWQVYRHQYRRALFSLGLLLLAWPLVRQTVAWATPTGVVSEQEGTGFSLASANVYSFKAPRQKNYPLDSAAIMAFVDRLSADVIALQEYDYKASNWRSQLVMQHGQLPYVRKIENGALVIFSRWPIQLVEEKRLLNSVNGYQVVDIQHPEGIFRLVNIHLKSNQITHIADQLQQEKNLGSKQNQYKFLQMFSRYGRASAIRTKQAEALANLVDQSPHPLLLVGDMNEVPTAYPRRLLLRSQRLQDAWLAAGRGVGATFAGSIPGLRIDYILADTSLQVAKMQVLEEGDADHRPLRAALRFKK